MGTGVDQVGVRPLGWRLAFWLTVLVICYLALKPAPASTDWFPEADKLRHAAAFFVLWALGALAGYPRWWGLAIGLLAFGVGIEVAQSFSPSRQASGLDVLADVAGMAAGAWVCRRRGGQVASGGLNA
jgi:VanZ family protein